MNTDRTRFGRLGSVATTVLRSWTVAGTVTATGDGAVSTEGTPTPIRRAKTMSLTPLHPDLVERSNGPLFWVLEGGTAATADAVLLAFLSLLIVGLVGKRLARTLSRRDVSVPATRHEEGDDEPAGADSGSEPAVQSVVSAATPSELLNDEGKVIKLLVENDGRMRQRRITAETGWSKSKVSRTVSEMHESGLIDKRSSGRENVITLRAYVPEENRPIGPEETRSTGPEENRSAGPDDPPS